MHRFRSAVLAAVLVAAGGLVVASTGTPASASTLRYWTGYVEAISDGDTVYVDITGDGTRSLVPIRNLNIQATEMHGENGQPECHAADATKLMAKLLPIGTHVRLAAYNATSTAGVDPKGVTRLLRYVDAYNPATHLYDIDVQLKLVQAGLVMATHHTGEDARYQQYAVEMQKAMAHRLGLFDTTRCGVGPANGAWIQMWIHYDADGADGAVPNTEWLRLRNVHNINVNLAGWKLRDGSHTWYHGQTYYTFPSYATLPVGKTITIYTGKGTDKPSAGLYYLNITQGAFFPNVLDPSLADPGRQMYLLDPQLDFRTWVTYPCLYECAHPPVHIKYVQGTTADEYVDITTDTGVAAPVDLTMTEVTNDGWTREINPGTILNPGETLRVYCERTGADTRTVQHWNHTGGTMLEDAGDTVVLRTSQSVLLSSYSWGRG